MGAHGHNRFLTELAGEFSNHPGRCEAGLKISDHHLVLLVPQHLRGLIEDRLLDIEARGGVKHMQLGLGLGGE
jgi:hypothetical protein